MSRGGAGAAPGPLGAGCAWSRLSGEAATAFAVSSSASKNSSKNRSVSSRSSRSRLDRKRRNAAAPSTGATAPVVRMSATVGANRWTCSTKGRMPFPVASSGRPSTEVNSSTSVSLSRAGRKWAVKGRSSSAWTSPGGFRGRGLSGELVQQVEGVDDLSTCWEVRVLKQTALYSEQGLNLP